MILAHPVSWGSGKSKRPEVRNDWNGEDADRRCAKWGNGILAFSAAVIVSGIAPIGSDLRYWVFASRSVCGLEGIFVLYTLLCVLSPRSVLEWFMHRTLGRWIALWGILVGISFWLSPYYSAGNSLAWIRLCETYLHVAFALSVAAYRSRGYLRIRSVAWGYGAGMAIVALWSLLGGFGRFETWGVNLNERRIGYLLEVGAIGMWIVSMESRRLRSAGILVAGAFLAVMVGLGGRASVLGFVTAAAIGSRWYGVKRTIVALSVVAFVAFSILSVERIVHPQRTVTIESRVRQSLGNDFHQITSGRDDVWRLWWSQWRRSPLLGGGPQSYFFYPHRPREVIHAHNFILQFLGELGVLGGGILLGIMGWIMHGAWRRARSCVWARGAFVSIAGLSLTGLFGGVYFFPDTSWILAFAYALAGASDQQFGSFSG